MRSENKREKLLPGKMSDLDKLAGSRTRGTTGLGGFSTMNL